jgi:hypothetical protein
MVALQKKYKEARLPPFVNSQINHGPVNTRSQDNFPDVSLKGQCCWATAAVNAARQEFDQE